MMRPTVMRFTKMHGAGNDYVYVDGFRDALPEDPAAVARLVSDRHFGIGADGLILICPPGSDVPTDGATVDAEMRMFNADGSESEMCGNGIRCVAKYLYDHGLVDRKSIRVATGAGVLELEVFVEGGKVGRVRVDMGAPVLSATKIPTLFPGDPSSDNRVVNETLEIDNICVRATCVSMGNPHCVLYSDEIVADMSTSKAMDRLVNELGPRIEHDPVFPARVNVEFVEVISRSEVRQRTWERGSGETLACGTGASAVCVAGVLTGRTDRELTCHLTGGTLQLAWDEATGHVFMTGPAVEVFRGEVEIPNPPPPPPSGQRERGDT